MAFETSLMDEPSLNEGDWVSFDPKTILGMFLLFHPKTLPSLLSHSKALAWL